MTNNSIWRRGPNELLADVRHLIEDRAPVEAELTSDLTAVVKKADKQLSRIHRRLTDREGGERADLFERVEVERQDVVAVHDARRSTALREYDDSRKMLMSNFEADKDKAEQDLMEARWHATAAFEAGRNAMVEQFREVQTRIEAEYQQFESIGKEAEKLLRRRWQWRKFPDPPPALPPFEGDPVKRFMETANLARQRLRTLHDQEIPSWYEGVRPLLIVLVWWALAAIPTAKICSGFWTWWNWYFLPISLGVGTLLAVLFGVWFYGIARRQTARAYLSLREILSGAALALAKTVEAVKANVDKQVAVAAEQRRQTVREADEASAKRLAQIRERYDRLFREAEEQYPSHLVKLAADRDAALQDLKSRETKQLDVVAARYRVQTERVQGIYQRIVSAAQDRYRQRWQQMAQRWRQGITQFDSGVGEVDRVCGETFPAWEQMLGRPWTPPSFIPPAVPFGRAALHLDRVKGGVPRDPKLAPPRVDYSLPAVLSFRDRSLLLLKAEEEGRGRAIETIQAVMLRTLTSFPPGKVRFMIIDPVGLGKNFSAFMHLADFNEQTVSNRIWTDANHIEQRLAEMTVHMEDVIQVYLRNEFPSIEDYNAFAGDLAEPYRVLVVANFPVGFSDPAAARLASIIASGARCGVYTLMSVDTRLRMPREFHLNDLEPHAVSLRWHEGRFEWEYPGLGALPVEADRPPASEHFTEIVRGVGRQLKDADRVEVPFEAVAPEEDAWWTADSRLGIDVPLGRAGAMKLQHLLLGRGTSQHVLVAGKTGSGKSTLWHALVTNIALRYSPDEVELYLVDFKKGVEFKAYAQAELPHARVIAIESEREFGLSVLERLDLELKRRGDIFRSLAVQDLAGFRAQNPHQKMPRVLLIVDEFQELFVEDDRIAQNAALLLDRLVRQGRAFGIHVLLGSQTLAGAYSLPRSTIGQMAVRIALQCSESDAHLILSEENTAARLLTRPGEAIYNDANGLFEGNHPFQVVWLPDDKREKYLRSVRAFARSRSYPMRTPIVFEGNAAADPTKNPLLNDLLDAPAWPEACPAPKAWLGAAVAIKDPTAVELIRQSGASVLVVGHQEETAMGVLTTAVVSLAAQQPPLGTNSQHGVAQFYVLDGTRHDSPLSGSWERLSRYLPHPMKIVQPRGTPAVISELAEELARREQSAHDHEPAIYLVIYDLGRFRDLRRNDEDFNFARYDENKPAGPAALFVRILREGPAVGIHTLIWCDTYNNVNRTLDRQHLRDLELRVLFQMNATDSSNLIDSPAAAQLGMHRAVFYDEGQGRLEKFRPFGVPPDYWLETLRQRFQTRLAARPADVP